jgi:uncharacterized membrane protein
MTRTLANTLAVGSAISVALLAIQQNTHFLPGSKKVFTHDRERCYGVVRAGKNDCGNAKHACAGHASLDADADEWLMLPAGACEQITGGRLKSEDAGNAPDGEAVKK